MNKTSRILIVDDEGSLRNMLAATLEQLNYETEQAADGFDALAKLPLDFDLVLLDLEMPGMDGFEVARRIRSEYDKSDLPICMITTFSGREERIRAVESGVNDFIVKPVDPTELKVRVASLIQSKKTQDALNRYKAELEAMVEHRTKHLRQALEEMVQTQRLYQKAQIEIIDRLALAAEYKDEDTGAHIKRMSRYCRMIARKLSLPPHDVETIFHASPMHDVGKMGIPDAVLMKPGKLNRSEWEMMKTHTLIGARILGNSTSELLKAGELIAISHHERWDGTGYPNGLAGEDIPLWGRISAVADVFDALTSRRPYKEPFSNEKAISIMREGRGSQFDPRILEVFLDNLPEVESIQARHGEADENSTAALESD